MRKLTYSDACKEVEQNLKIFEAKDPKGYKYYIKHKEAAKKAKGTYNLDVHLSSSLAGGLLLSLALITVFSIKSILPGAGNMAAEFGWFIAMFASSSAFGMGVIGGIGRAIGLKKGKISYRVIDKIRAYEKEYSLENINYIEKVKTQINEIVQDASKLKEIDSILLYDPKFQEDLDKALAVKGEKFELKDEENDIQDFQKYLDEENEYNGKVDEYSDELEEADLKLIEEYEKSKFKENLKEENEYNKGIDEK